MKKLSLLILQMLLSEVALFAKEMFKRRFFFWSILNFMFQFWSVKRWITMKLYIFKTFVDMRIMKVMQKLWSFKLLQIKMNQEEILLL